MPLTRIDVTDTISSDRLSALADALHQAAVETTGITPDNRHQIIHVHHADKIIADERFMDLDRGQEQVIVQITLPGTQPAGQARPLPADRRSGRRERRNRSQEHPRKPH